MRTAAWALLAMVAGTALADATGRVVGPDGVPIAGAQVCEFVDDTPEHCVIADATGFYRMEKPVRGSLLVRASGYVGTMVDAVPLTEPVALRRAAILLVTVVDAVTGKPVPSGRVMIDSPSGRRIGDFVPFNRSGVRVSTLDPGPVFVRAVASGYQPAGPLPIELVAGAERSLQIPMTKSDHASH